MSVFDIAVKRVLEHEGGYSHHRRDPGGATNYGITKRVARLHGYTGDMRDFPVEKAIEIYRKDYWMAVRGDELPPATAWQVFDAAVNSGPRKAIHWLQGAVGVIQDGIIGPRTMAAVKAKGDAKTAVAILAERLDFMTDLNTWDVFGKGWARRIADNIRYAAGDM